MSEENVEVVRAALDALNSWDLDAALNDAAPTFEFDFTRSRRPPLSSMNSKGSPMPTCGSDTGSMAQLGRVRLLARSDSWVGSARWQRA